MNKSVLVVFLGLAACSPDIDDQSYRISLYAGDVVINEIAWMGDSTSYLREWIELHNTTASSIDVSGWVVEELDGTPSVTLPAGAVIDAGGYYLLARTSSAGAVEPNDLTYSGNLENTKDGRCKSNTSVQLKLYDNVGAEVEYVDNNCVKKNRTWYAGDNGSKFTMERIDPLGAANDGANWANSTVVDGTPGATNSVVAGLGPCQYPATLELTFVDIGQGDASIIATPTKIMLADTGESYWNSSADARTLDLVLTSKYGCRNVDYVVLSHLQVDHVGYPGYGGLWYLAEQLGYNIGETLLRDYDTNIGGTSGTYDNWIAYLDSANGRANLNARTAIVGEVLDLGDGVTVTITNVDTKTVSCPGGWGSTPDLSCGGTYVVPSEVLGNHNADYPSPSENDYSVGFVVSLGDFDAYIGGDTSGETLDSGFGSKLHDVESYLARDVGEIDVLRVNHHGSDHSTNDEWVVTLDPQVAAISVGNANTYGHSRQTVIDRLLGVVAGTPTRDTWLYLTQRGDDGLGNCGTDYSSSYKAAAELYGRATITGDTDGDPCTIEGGDVDVVVSADGSSFTVEGDAYVSVASGSSQTFCGDGTCNPGETQCTCAADCGAPPASEIDGATCDDGLDNDCDGAADSADTDCPAAGPVCGNSVCEGNGENGLTCPIDCRCSGKDCRNGNCGDGICFKENSSNCPVDCAP